jgi:glycosyltransferase involved in cell wall biosynthesis
LKWSIITGEYPPQQGGVADYTRLVAHGLAQSGDEVTVWAPPVAAENTPDAPVRVRRLSGHFGLAALRQLNVEFHENSTARLLVQYVPHAYGLKGMNLPFCLWLFAHRNLDISLMFHEVAYPFGSRQIFTGNILAATNRLMALLLGRGARRIFITIPAWEQLLRPLVGSKKSIKWLPIPSNIPIDNDPAARSRIRLQYIPAEGVLIGHFGTYGSLITEKLAPCIPRLLRSESSRRVLLLGCNSKEFLQGLLASNPELSGRIHATGELEPRELSHHLAACDLMIQPYPDGVTSRRGSVVVALSHGRPVVTNLGHLTEGFWRESGAVRLCAGGEPASLAASAEALIADEAERGRLGLASQQLYSGKFDIRWTIRGLRDPEN